MRRVRQDLDWIVSAGLLLAVAATGITGVIADLWDLNDFWYHTVAGYLIGSGGLHARGRTHLTPRPSLSWCDQLRDGGPPEYRGPGMRSATGHTASLRPPSGARIPCSVSGGMTTTSPGWSAATPWEPWSSTSPSRMTMPSRSRIVAGNLDDRIGASLLSGRLAGRAQSGGRASPDSVQ
jgi:hypothetical protein